jgi:hypothetical protein
MKKIICASVWSETFALLSAFNYQRIWEWPIQGRSVLFVGLLHRIEQGIADTATSRQGTEE